MVYNSLRADNLLRFYPFFISFSQQAVVTFYVYVCMYHFFRNQIFNLFLLFLLFIPNFKELRFFSNLLSLFNFCSNIPYTGNNLQPLICFSKSCSGSYEEPFCEIILYLGHLFRRRCRFKYCLSTALAAILFGVAEQFWQLW